MNSFLLFIPRILQTAVWIPTRLFLKLCCRLQVMGIENLKNLPPGVIFAANHISELDPILLPASLPMFSRLMPIFYVSREREFYKYCKWRKYIYGGTFFKCWGAYPAQVGLKNYALSLKNHIDLLQRGKSVLIFPEGRRNLEGGFGEAKGGVAFLSYFTQKPVVPVYLSGHYKMRFRDCFLRRRKILIVFGRPMMLKQASADWRFFAAHVREKILLLQSKAE